MHVAYIAESTKLIYQHDNSLAQECDKNYVHHWGKAYNRNPNLACMCYCVYIPTRWHTHV